MGNIRSQMAMGSSVQNSSLTQVKQCDFEENSLGEYGQQWHAIFEVKVNETVPAAAFKDVHRRRTVVA